MIKVRENIIKELSVLGYPSISEMVKEGMEKITADNKKYTKVVGMVGDDVRAFSVYKTKNFTFLRVEGMYFIITDAPSGYMVSEMPEDIMEIVNKMTIKNINLVMNESPNAPLNLVELLISEEMAVCS